MRFSGLTARIAAAFTIVLALHSTTSAAELGRRGLLKLEGQYVKWGALAYGTGAHVTYAFLTEGQHVKDAINCRDMLPMNMLLIRAGLDPQRFESEIEAAFATWAKVANVSFSRVSDPAKADIVLGTQLGDRGVAFTNVAPKVHSASGIDQLSKSLICFDPAERWELGIDGDSKTYSVHYVAAHEIGHALGLDHQGRFGGVMGYGYRELPGQSARARLAASDIAAIVELYGPADGFPLGVQTVAADPREGISRPCETVLAIPGVGPAMGCAITGNGDAGR